MEGPSSNEKDISVAEMRLLITAVISFKSDEIVTAILNVEKLKAALKLQLSKTNASNDSPQNEHQSLTNDGHCSSNDSHSVESNLSSQCNGSSRDMCMKMDLAPDVGVTLANVEAESINLTDNPGIVGNGSYEAERNGVNMSPKTIHSTGSFDDNPGGIASAYQHNESAEALSRGNGHENHGAQFSQQSPINLQARSKIDQLLNKHQHHSDSLMETADFLQPTSRVTVTNTSKPLNLSMSRSRKRKNFLPRYLPGHVNSIVSCIPEQENTLLTPCSLTQMRNITASEFEDGVAKIDVVDPNLCGPFVTPNLQPLYKYNAAPGRNFGGGGSFDDENVLEANAGLDLSNVSMGHGDDLMAYAESAGTWGFIKPEPKAPGTAANKKKRTLSNHSKAVNSAIASGSKSPVINIDNGNQSPVSTPSSGLRLRCRRCNERFTTKADYQHHLRTQVCSTSYTQTHTCHICGYCALTRQRLIVHMRTHSGERPHRCPFCSYAATQPAPLKRHIQNIHMKQGAISLST